MCLMRRFNGWRRSGSTGICRIAFITNPPPAGKSQRLGEHSDSCHILDISERDGGIAFSFGSRLWRNCHTVFGCPGATAIQAFNRVTGTPAIALLHRAGCMRHVQKRDLARGNEKFRIFRCSNPSRNASIWSRRPKAIMPVQVAPDGTAASWLLPQYR
jgi:hypothetical protein